MAKYSITCRGDKKLKKVLLPIVAVVLAVGLALPAAAMVEPPRVEAELQPGGFITIDKEVQTPESLPLTVTPVVVESCEFLDITLIQKRGSPSKGSLVVPIAF